MAIIGTMRLAFLIFLAACGSEPEQTFFCGLDRVDWEAGSSAHLEMLNFYSDGRGEWNELVDGRREEHVLFEWSSRHGELSIRPTGGAPRALRFEVELDGEMCELQLSAAPVEPSDFEHFEGPSRRE